MQERMGEAWRASLWLRLDCPKNQHGAARAALKRAPTHSCATANTQSDLVYEQNNSFLLWIIHRHQATVRRSHVGEGWVSVTRKDRAPAGHVSSMGLTRSFRGEQGLSEWKYSKYREVSL